MPSEAFIAEREACRQALVGIRVKIAMALATEAHAVEQADCPVCVDNKQCFKLGCNHHTCVDCYKTMVTTSFNDQNIHFFDDGDDPSANLRSCPICRKAFVGERPPKPVVEEQPTAYYVTNKEDSDEGTYFTIRSEAEAYIATHPGYWIEYCWEQL